MLFVSDSIVTVDITVVVNYNDTCKVIARGVLKNTHLILSVDVFHNLSYNRSICLGESYRGTPI